MLLIVSVVMLYELVLATRLIGKSAVDRAASGEGFHSDGMLHCNAAARHLSDYGMHGIGNSDWVTDCSDMIFCSKMGTSDHSDTDIVLTLIFQHLQFFPISCDAVLTSILQRLQVLP